ncbi:MAG: hypothetical protein DRR04_13330, partial [Gammaproteobacteria bacterium]
MAEIPFFFESNSHELFGIVHEPNTADARAAIVLCHAFGEEKLWSHRVLLNFARQAASQNIAVLRFDFMGHGDSTGSSEECTMDSYYADIEAAVATLSDRYPHVTQIGLLGLRFGATLISQYCRHRNVTAPMILWEPITDGNAYMQELLRINLSTQLATYGQIDKNREMLVQDMRGGNNANVDGYLISGSFYEQCTRTKLPDTTTPKLSGRCLVVQIAPNIKRKNRQVLLDLAAAYSPGAFEKVEM